MTTAFVLAIVLQQAAGTVVWETPTAPAVPVEEPPPRVVTHNLPDWALADPFGWERSQCSPLVRKTVTLEACQSRVRGELTAALGDELPTGLRPSGELVPCLATPGADGSFPVRCGTPERPTTAEVTPTIQDCRSRPVRQGGAMAFTTDCRPNNQTSEGGLSFRLFGPGED